MRPFVPASSENSLSHDWSKLLDSGDLSDLTIFSKEEFPFPVHTVVMHARCKSILVSLGKNALAGGGAA